MSRGQSIEIGRLGRLHSRGTGAKVLEDRGLPVLIGHTIPLEHDSSLELPFGMPFRELGVLFDAYPKEVAEVNFDPLPNSFICDVGPFAHHYLIPHVFVAKSIPFCLHGCSSLWSAKDFRFTHRARDTCIEQQRILKDLVAVVVNQLIVERLLNQYAVFGASSSRLVGRWWSGYTWHRRNHVRTLLIASELFAL